MPQCDEVVQRLKISISELTPNSSLSKQNAKLHGDGHPLRTGRNGVQPVEFIWASVGFGFRVYGAEGFL